MEPDKMKKCFVLSVVTDNRPDVFVMVFAANSDELTFHVHVTPVKIGSFDTVVIGFDEPFWDLMLEKKCWPDPQQLYDTMARFYRGEHLDFPIEIPHSQPKHVLAD